MQNNSNLQISINPGEVFINTSPGQFSYANLTVTVTNNGAAASITGIAITLPAALAPLSGLGSIALNMDSVTAGLWNFSPSQLTSGEFDASPQTGSNVAMPAGGVFSFTLDMVTLPATVLAPSAQVAVVVAFADGTSVSQSPTVTMAAATASIVFFNAPSSNISPGGSAMLQWQCTGIDYCILSPVGTSQLKATGNCNVSPPATTSYTLYAYAAGTILAAQWQVSVENPAILTFGGAHGAPTTDYNTTINLVWRCNQFTESITITDSNGTNIPTNILTYGNTVQQGKVTVGPITSLTTFTLTAYGAGGINFTEQPVTIGITDISAQLTLTPATGVICEKEEVTLSWSIISAVSATISPALPNGQTQLAGAGSIKLYPLSDINYTLTANGFIGNKPVTLTKPVSMTVIPTLINSFMIDCPPMGPGVIQPKITLTWSTQAQVVTIDNGVGVVAEIGSVTISAPPNDTIITLSAGTKQYPNICTAQVKVINYCGPYSFTSFKNNIPVPPSPFWPSFITSLTQLPVSNPGPGSLLPSNQYGIIPYPVNVTGINSSTSGPYGILEAYFDGGSWYVGQGPFAWDNPNDQTGTISIQVFPFAT